MGIAIPQVITNRSGAQVIDGSLKFDSSKKNELRRTPSSAGNRRTWTWSAWVKRLKQGSSDHILFAASNGTGSVSRGGFFFDNTNDLRFFSNPSGSSETASFNTNGLFRDTAWYHVVLQIDTTQSTNTDRIKIYVNGERQTPSSATYMAQNEQAAFNQAILHTLGSYQNGDYGDYHLTNVYFIDGQALGPENFGFTDPLTNTWKPKKYKVALAETVTVQPSYVSKSNVLDEANAFDGSSSTEATYSGTGSWLSFTVDASNLTVPFEIRNDSSGTAQTVAMFTDSSGSSAAGGYWGSTGTNNLSPAVSTTVETTYTFPSAGTYYLRHTVGTDSNIFVYRIGGSLTTGANSFYLPLDGNLSIGEDQSGNGNDFTPANFGCSVELDSPLVTGARPILNTTQGGTTAGVGVFGSKQNVGYAVTVYDDGGGNKYYIDGVKQATLTGLIRGATYTFDTSDSTVSSHPFRFSDSDGGSEYPHGVAAITGTATTITIPHNAPNELYYYCTSHSGMGSSITGITTNASLADPFAWKCTLALPLVGGVGDVSPSIACTASSKTTSSDNLTFVGPGDMFYGIKNSTFTGDGSSNSRVTFPAGSLPFGTGDFTIEFWAHLTATGDQGNRNARILTAQSESGTYVQFVSSTTTDKFQFKYNSGEPANISIDNDLVEDRTRHFVYQRTGTTGQLIVDGVLYDTGTDNSNYADVAYQIGRYDATNGGASLHMADFRVYSGIQKYSTTGKSVGDQIFTSPSPSPDILPNTPSGVSGGSKLTKITDGAVAFDGSGDYLQIGQTTDLNFGTGDFTIESFFYVSDTTNSDQALIASGSASFASGAVTFKAWNTFFGNEVVVQPYDYNSGGTPIVRSGRIASNKWYHVAYTRSGNDHMLFIDGELKDTTTSSISINFNDNNYTMIGYSNLDSSNGYMDGFISNLRVIKGTALYTSRFTPPTAPLTNVTNTKLLTCQSVGIITATVAPTGIGVTVSGDAAATIFNPFNTDINTVRGQETGYCTYSTLDSAGSHTVSEGNLKVTCVNDANALTRGTVATPVDSGKWFWENELTLSVGAGFGAVGTGNSFDVALWTPSSGYGYYSEGSNYTRKISGGTQTAYGDYFVVGDTIGVALDLDNSEITFYKNGVSQGVAFSNLESGSYAPAFSSGTNSGTAACKSNFGQKPFKFPPPDGFQPLNTANTRPANVISRPDQYVGIVTYRGTGTTSQSITGLNFNAKPDLVWIKDYSSSSNYSHRLADSVRGSTKVLFPDNTNSVQTNEYGTIDKFTLNGFDLRQGSNNNGDGSNTNGSALVAWCWRAGGSKNTFNVDDVGYATAAAAGLGASGNSWDSDPTGASIGTKQGFSIIKHTGTGSTGTLPHGLTQKPTFYISKPASTTGNWVVYFDFIDGSLDYLYLNGSDARGNSSQSVPTSELFSYGYTANEYIHYLWHDVPGLQKFGTYQGNGSANGPYVELGFRPAVVIVKYAHTTGSASWFIYDSERGKINQNNNTIMADRDVTEQTSYGIDFLSNGFKLRYADSSGYTNYSATYVYAAWAEAPTIDLYGGGANAR